MKDATAEATETTVAIIGGGPHALAVLSALHEHALSTAFDSDSAAFRLRVGARAELVGSVAVMVRPPHLVRHHL